MRQGDACVAAPTSRALCATSRSRLENTLRELKSELAHSSNRRHEAGDAAARPPPPPQQRPSAWQATNTKSTQCYYKASGACHRPVSSMAIASALACDSCPERGCWQVAAVRQDGAVVSLHDGLTQYQLGRTTCSKRGAQCLPPLNSCLFVSTSQESVSALDARRQWHAIVLISIAVSCRSNKH